MNHSTISSRLGKIFPAQQSLEGLHVRDKKGISPQDAQKARLLILPPQAVISPAPSRVCQDRLFALGHALSPARPQQAKRRGGTYRPSCGPFALATGLGERESPYSVSDLRETPAHCRASKRSENAAGGHFQHPDGGSYPGGRVERKAAPSCFMRSSHRISSTRSAYLRVQFG